MQAPATEHPQEEHTARRAELDRRAALVIAATKGMPMRSRIRAAIWLLHDNARLPTAASWDGVFARWRQEQSRAA